MTNDVVLQESWIHQRQDQMNSGLAASKQRAWNVALSWKMISSHPHPSGWPLSSHPKQQKARSSQQKCPHTFQRKVTHEKKTIPGQERNRDIQLPSAINHQKPTDNQQLCRERAIYLNQITQEESKRTSTHDQKGGIGEGGSRKDGVFEFWQRTKGEEETDRSDVQEWVGRDKNEERVPTILGRSKI